MTMPGAAEAVKTYGGWYCAGGQATSVVKSCEVLA